MHCYFSSIVSFSSRLSAQRPKYGRSHRASLPSGRSNSTRLRAPLRQIELLSSMKQPVLHDVGDDPAEIAQQGQAANTSDIPEKVNFLQTHRSHTRCRT